MKSYLPQMAAILGVTSGRGSPLSGSRSFAPALTLPSGFLQRKPHWEPLRRREALPNTQQK